MRNDDVGLSFRSRRWLPALCTTVALLAAGCVNGISADEALLDEFAAFKARGGQCLDETAGASAVPGALADATRYGWHLFTALSLEVVTADGRVRYEHLLGDVELRELARLSVVQLRELDVKKLAGGPARLAFWINAYNSLTLVAAAEAFAADPAFRVDQNNFAFFDQEVHAVGGEVLSLNQIENVILRGDRFHPAFLELSEERQQQLLERHADIWGNGSIDPRFHFVLNCASSSCPPLRNSALREDDLERVFEESTAAFLQDEVRGAGPDGISQIFSFYYSDFEAVGGLEAFLSRYRSLDDIDTSRFLDYDWGLNGAP